MTDSIQKLSLSRRIFRYSVNTFIYFFVLLIVLLLTISIISQTYLFKNWLKEKLVELVNNEINGKLYLEKIDGTFFTSLELYNLSLTTNENDTVFTSAHFIIKISPLKLLLNDIYIKNIELKNLHLNLLEESDGQLNLLKIFLPSDTPDDTTEINFPFTISIAELKINNLNFKFQNFENVGSSSYYKYLNTNDLRISNLDLSLAALININKSDFKVNIKKLSFKPNLEFFELKNLSGDFLLTKNLLMANNLIIETQKSNLNFSTAISGIDLLSDFSMEDLANADIRLELNINNFNFIDLVTFVKTTNFLNGNIYGYLNASGSLNNLSIDKLNLFTGETEISCNAKLNNLLDVKKFEIDAVLDNSKIRFEDVSSFLNGLNIPQYKFGNILLKKLKYKGKPTEFITEAEIDTEQGNLTIIGTFNLKQSKYDVILKTNKLNIYPLTNFNTNLNSEIKISGEGFYPLTMTANLSCVLNDSRFETFNISSLEFDSKIFEKILLFNLDLQSDTITTQLLGKIDFIRELDPYFTLKAKTENLDLSKLSGDTSYSAIINTNFDLEGRGFDIDSMNLFMIMDVNNTRINNINIDSTRIILDLRRNEGGNKIFNLISNIADFTISGNYKLSSLINTIAKQTEFLSNQIKNKLSNPLDLQTATNTITLEQYDKLSNQQFEAKLLLDLKEFIPFNIDKNNSIEIGGEIKGNLKSAKNFVSLQLQSNIDYLKLITPNQLYFLTRSNIDLFLKQFTAVENNFSTILNSQLKFERIYFGNNIYNFYSKISLNNDTVNFLAKGVFEESLKFDFNSTNFILNDKIQSKIDNLSIIFKDIPISNNNDLNISYSKGNFIADQVNLNFDGGNLDIKGEFGKTHDGVIEFKLTKLNGQSILNNLFDLPPTSKINSDIKLSGTIRGNFAKPIISLNSHFDNIYLNSNSFGSINSDIIYSEQKLNIELKLYNQYQNNKIEKISIIGIIPLKEFSTVQQSNINDDNIDLKVLVDDLDISPLGKIIPGIEFKKGILESEVFIKGTIEKPLILGYFNINDMIAKPDFNNLDYYINSKIYWDDEIINISETTISNKPNLKYGGKILCSGILKLQEFKLDSISINAKGNLKILDQNSKEVNPIIYGDLSVETSTDIVFWLNKNEMNLLLPLTVNKADLVLPIPKTDYSNPSNIIYKFALAEQEESDIDFQLNKLILELEKKKNNKVYKKPTRIFNYDVYLAIKDEAKVTVILSKELNQDLVALLSGEIKLSAKEGIQRTTGQFNLLEGSKLTFIKSFDARGNLKFDHLANPSIDITATYQDYYSPVTETGTSTEEEVAVKIRLKGLLNELNQNFVKDPENIGVYIGKENILKEQRDQSKTPTDALFFIIAGKFTDGATAQERNAVANTATNFAGSILGSVLNQYLGDYVRNVQLKQLGDQTKFSLIGKAGNFKYEIGGTSEIFQDFSRANVKIELPVQQHLILRLERKESFSVQSSLSSALYNEFSIKYKFEF